MRRNRGVVYTGHVGSKLRVRKRSVSRRRVWQRFRCYAGPFAGQTIKLDPSSGSHTFVFTVRSHTGMYRGGNWEHHIAYQEAA